MFLRKEDKLASVNSFGCAVNSFCCFTLLNKFKHEDVFLLRRQCSISVNWFGYVCGFGQFG